MQIRIENRTALITGSTSGIGLAMAEKFAEAGANIIFNGLVEKEEQGHALAEQVAKKYDVKTLFDPANVMESQSCRAFVKSAAEKMGGLDIMVNNVGAQFVKPLEEYPEDQWRRILTACLDATFYGTQAAIPFLKKSKAGRILITASALAQAGVQNKIAYMTAKHGLLGFMKGAALELAQYRITCNSICPGFVWTPHVEKQIAQMQALNPGMSETDVKNNIMLEGHARKEFVQVDEVGALALFLASDYADSITGAAHYIDHGWTAR